MLSTVAPPAVRTAAVTAVLAGTAALLAAPALAGGGSRADGDLVRYPSSPPALTDVPAGATASVHSVETGSGRTMVTLHVKGMRPHTAYGAHAHVDACGTSGAQAGPHYQYRLDPAATPSRPSSDPAYANPGNEIWLDLTTNAAGNGSAKAVVDWTFPSERRPGSVILHLRHTATGPGDAGTAGPRLACLTVPF